MNFDLGLYKNLRPNSKFAGQISEFGRQIVYDYLATESAVK